MQIAYIEKDILAHPRAERILQKLNPLQTIQCDHYKEIFNPKAQNFRIQKKQPNVILAEKKGQRIMPSPEGFGIGSHQNYYFSHMLNCLYDCRYCFLQGMYSSANYVLFINYEDFMNDIESMDKTAASPLYFFSGYDCDSLAFEPITHFVHEFVPFFRSLKNSFLEIRTKSTNIKSLLKQESYSHCVIAFSFTPDEISREIEHKVPSVQKRIDAMKMLAEQGWLIGLRFDPLIYHPEFKKLYQNLVETIFKHISPTSLHSISLGPMRFPEKMYHAIVKLYPNDPLLTHPLYRQGKLFSYKKEVEHSMKKTITDLLQPYINKTILFECQL